MLANSISHSGRRDGWITGRLALRETLKRQVSIPECFVRLLRSDFRPPSQDDTPCAVLETAEGESFPLLVRSSAGSLQLTFDWERARWRLLNEEYVPSADRPLMSRLPFDYNRIPQPIIQCALSARRYLLRSKDSQTPRYTLDLSVDVLDLLHALAENTYRRRTDEAPAPFFLTYDMDRGWLFQQDGLFERLLALLDELGAKATWFVVAAHSRSNSVQAKLKRLLDEGHEVGLHGIRHEMKLPFQPAHRIREQLQAWKGFLNDYQIVGFRAPWYQSSDALESVLPEFFCYDSSIPTTSFQSPGEGARGCCTAVPFRRSSLWILPITIPWEEELLMLRYQADEILSVWRETSAIVRRLQGGVGVFVGHWDPGHLAREDLFEIHERFLRSRGKQWLTNVLPSAFFKEKFVDAEN